MTAPAAQADARPVAQAIAESARVALGAIAVDLAQIEPDLQITVLAWAVEPGTRYDRALAAARRIVPDIDPLRVSFDANVNPFVGSVHLLGATMVGPFEDASRYTVHPMVAGFAATMLGLRWTLSVPLRVGPRVVGSLSAHFSRPPTDEQRSTAASLAREAAAELDKVGAFG